MATFFELFIAGGSEVYARKASRAAFAEIDRLESLFSRFDPSSEISRLARLLPGDSMRIGVETAEILEFADLIRQETGGAFDISWQAAERGLPRPPQAGARAGTGPAVGRPTFLAPLKISRKPGFFLATRPKTPSKGPGRGQPLELDLGGIGKGWALDGVKAVLGDWDIDNAMAHAGTSSVLAWGAGPDPQRPGWPVRLSCRASDPPFSRTIRLRDRALSGSGPEVKGPHIVDPRTGRRASGKLMAWASAPSAAVSDALSTAFFVMEQDAIGRFCRDHPEIWAVVITARKKCKMFNVALE
jgi:thiamine biosynthesis lipoprotein